MKSICKSDYTTRMVENYENNKVLNILLLGCFLDPRFKNTIPQGRCNQVLEYLDEVI